MSADLMHRIRALDPLAGEPPLATDEAVLRRILTEPRPQLSRRARPRRRPAVVAAALGALALVAMGMVAIRTKPRPPDPLATAASARVDWGLIARVELRQVRGESLDEARSRLRRDIAEQARRMDAAGVTVADVGPGVVEVTLPGAQVSREATEFVATVGARATAVGTRQYGLRAEMRGPTVTPREPVRSMAPRATRWIRVVPPVRRRGSTLSLLVAVRRTIPIAVAVDGPGGFASGSSRTPTCGDGVGTPRVQVCRASVGGGMSLGGRMVRVDSVYGRVRPEVARVAARSVDGTLVDASIANGWFFISADTIGPNPSGAHLLKYPARLLAWDVRGRRVPVVLPWVTAAEATP